MKRYVTTIGTSILCLGIFAFLTFAKNTPTKTIKENDGDYENEAMEATKIQAYAEWLNGLRANPKTGRVDAEDVLKAKQQIAEYYAKNSRDGSLLNLAWESMGPNNVGGRTRAILIDKNNPEHMYAGGVSGGVFYSDNGGLQWYPHPANPMLGSLLVTSISQSADGSSLYIGTGESLGLSWYDGSSSYTHSFTGNGIYKCSNVGDHATETFELLSTTEPTPGTMGALASAPWGFINRIACSPVDNNVVMASTNSGLKISTDGGLTWSNCSTSTGSSLSANSGDVAFDADGYAHAIYLNKYYRSITAGDPSVLDQTGIGVPTSGFGRIVIGLAPSDPNYVYLYGANTSGQFGGVYRSTDRGFDFINIGPGGPTDFFNPPGDQGTYDLCIAVNPTDKDRIYIGGQINTYTWSLSTNSWTAMTSSGYPVYYTKYIHADQHFIIFHPTNPNVMYVGCDGGISRTQNASAAFPDFTTLNKGYDVTQAHGVAVGIHGEAIGGNQDNGTQFVNFLGNSPLEAKTSLGGDGGKAEISKIRPLYIFGEYADFPGGAVNGATLKRSVNGGVSSASIFDCHIDKDGGTTGDPCDPDGDADNGGDFVTPFVLWENYDLYNTFKAILDEGGTAEYPVGSGIFYSNGDVVNYGGRTITLNRSTISESHLYLASLANVWMTTGALYNSTEAPVWFKLSTDTTVFGRVTAFEFDNTGDILYYGTSGGRLYKLTGLLNANYTYNADDTWDPSDAGITTFLYPQTFGNTITGISIDRDDANKLVLSIAGYGVDANVQYTSNALSDGASTFSSLSSSGKLADIPVFDILLLTSDPDKILAATEYGVWSYSLSGGGDWTQEVGSIDPDTNDEYDIESLGNCPVFEIREDWIRDTNCKAIYLGSHGRGFWRSTTLAIGGCDFKKVNEEVTAGPIQEEIIAGIVISPNPAHNSADACITLAQPATVGIKIYSMSGMLMSNLGSTYCVTGVSHIMLDVHLLTPGIYLVVFDINGTLISKKLSVF